MSGRLLAVTGGHRYDVPAFGAMVDAVCEVLGWTWALAEQPAAQRWLRPEHAGVWDAVLLHDLPGLHLARGAEPEPWGPDDDTAEAVLALLRAGQGVVATHHALAGWPAWGEWAEVLGGRFLYAPGTVRGVDTPASGYRMATYTVEVADPAHPVCEGVDPFDLDDELYCCPVFADVVEPLLLTGARVDAPSMIDTHAEVATGERRAALPQPSSPLVGWSRTYGASRVVYLLPGHGPTTMASPGYRRLLANACRWVADSTTAR